MNKLLLDAVNKSSVNEVKEVVSLLVPNDTNDSSVEAIIEPSLLLRLDKWMNNTLGMDDFAKTVNRFLYVLSEGEKEYSTQEFVEYLRDDLGMDIKHIQTDYTYNNPDFYCLEKDIVFTKFTYEDTSYAIISIHHGMDARMGFGPSICFLVDEDYFVSSMSIDAYDSKTKDSYPIYEVDRIASFDTRKGKWIHNENSSVIELTSEANGW